jgi:hypothetical protein
MAKLIQRIIVHPDNKGEAERGAILASRHENDLIWTATSLDEALELYERHSRLKWHHIDCDFGNWLPSRFVGRDRLFERVRQFLRENQSGYLVLVHEMGWGKTSFLAELVHRAWQRGLDPVYHFIRGIGDFTSQTQAIVGCLYHRLLRKHSYWFHEPDHWQNDPLKIRLQRFLEQFSQRFKGEIQAGREPPEVLYLDAADQATLDDESLLPGVLSTLPEGVYCIITSRTRLDWLQWRFQQVTMEEIGHDVADRRDAREYLQWRGERLQLPLREGLINQIVLAERPPVFFTLNFWLRQLETRPPGPELSHLYNDPKPWLSEPEKLVDEEAERVLKQAKRKDISPAKFWETLGFLALLRSELSQHDLEQLGLWEETMEKVVTLAANFFRPVDPLQPDAPLRFAHPGYARKILQMLSAGKVQKCLRRVAEACDGWKSLSGGARQYALEWRLEHWLEAGDYECLAKAFGDVGFATEVITQFGRAILYEAACRAMADSRLDASWKKDFQNLERFLRFRMGRVREFPEAYGQELVNELRPQLTGPLAACLPNNFNGFWLRKRSGRPALGRLEHTSPIRSVSFSPDGQLVASGSVDRTVKVWEARTGQRVADWLGHNSPVASVCFSPDGQLVASGSWDGTVKVWEAQRGVCRATLFFDNAIAVVAFIAGDPPRLLVANFSGEVFDYELASGLAGGLSP